MQKEQTNTKPGELINPYNGYVLCNIETEAYNRYSEDCNRVSCEQTKNLILDNRHKFFVTRGDIETLPKYIQAILKAY